MRAAVVTAFDQPLQLQEVPVPTPEDGQVLVKIEASGLCHTDIHAAHGDWPIPPPLPLVPGHEGVGLVEALGPGVTNLKEGDRVSIPWLGWACGTCECCTSGWEPHCPQGRYTGYFVNGCHADYAVASADFVVPVPGGVDIFDAAALTCAGITTFKAVKVSGAGHGDLVAIFGIGGLGHLAVQYARLAGAEVVAVDRQDSRLALAEKLGATHTVNSANEGPGAAVQELGGASAAIVTSSGMDSYSQALGALKRRGTLVAVGVPKENDFPLPILQTLIMGWHIVPSAVGTRAELAEVLDLQAAGRTTVVRETRPLNDINQAIADVEAGKMDARVVFDVRS
ncbi:MAG TPA: zinc-dependent alcohol dehydrogenase [Acidimicrobiales bacterium]|nr:zinc-dependent alcohol dehydrogenase [Acidimicrobiales bacterium]